MPTKRAKKSKITKPKKRRAPAKKSTKSIYQKVNVNVQSGGGGGGAGGMSQPTAPHHPIPQNSQIPQSFYDKTGENVKLNNIIELLNKQEKKLNPMHTNDPFDFEYGRIPDYVGSSNSSVSSLPFEDVIKNKTESDFGTIESDYRTMESIEPYFGSYDQIETVPQNPILNIPDDTSNKSLVDRVVDAVDKPIEEPANNETVKFMKNKIKQLIKDGKIDEEEINTFLLNNSLGQYYYQTDKRGLKQLLNHIKELGYDD
jgi:hypothetical protein